MQPHYLKLTKSGEENPGVKKEGELSLGHYEQAGRFQGWIEIRGERIGDAKQYERVASLRPADEAVGRGGSDRTGPRRQ